MGHTPAEDSGRALVYHSTLDFGKNDPVSDGRPVFSKSNLVISTVEKSQVFSLFVLITLCCLAVVSIPLLSYEILVENPATTNLGYGLHWSHTLNGEADLLKEFLKPGYVVIDGGANVGAWSQAALSTNTSPTIYAFEPVPSVFELCSKNLAGTRATPINLALSDVDGKRDCFFVYGKSPDDMQTCSCHYQPNLGAPDACISIEQTTLDAFCKKKNIHSIDFFKLDVEGHELCAIRGAASLLHDKAIKGIQFEYGFPFRGSKATLKEIYDLLSSNGYLIFRIMPGGCIFLPSWSDTYENYQYANFFAVLPSAIDGKWMEAIQKTKDRG